MRKSHQLGAAVLSAVALAGPLAVAVAGPAQATKSADGCSFTALAPTFAGHDAQGYKLYAFTVKGTCSPGRSGGFRTEAWEQDKGKPGDSGADDLLGSWHGTWSSWQPGQVRYWTHKMRLPLDESDGFEELYHRVRFRVTSDNGVAGELSAWDYSAVVKAPH